ncbi:MAG: hypothetical protein CVU77_00845 [Elusimicrobia bacterium HGW-Elusimicrobia-1]|jgi:carbamoyltransferase|nr:MAG: hypothetical protein CVU77_00845 [Elusimicrobia bacterium HGW-Elusimicrobia-1]
MYILGFNCNIHMSAAALIKDGKLIAACEEERFDRKKYSGDFPRNAILFCCRQAGITPAEIDEAVFYMKPWLGIVERAAIFAKNFPGSLATFGKHKHERGTVEVVAANFLVRRRLKELGFRGRFRFLEHHLAHAASAFFVSPFDEAAILSVDFAGEIVATYLGRGSQNSIRGLRRINYPDSLGLFYGVLTEYLGYHINGDEYKVMGLASYGKPVFADVFRKMMTLSPDGGIKMDLSYFQHHTGSDIFFTQKYVDALGAPPCRSEDDLENQVYRDIAASGQLVFQEAMDHIVDRLKEETGSDNLCLVGGCALNSRYNGKLAARRIFKNIFIQPAAYDAGCAVGAAFYLWNAIMGNPRGFVMEHAYWGPEYSAGDLLSALAKYDLRYEKSSDAPAAAARLLADGKIIGWFQGRCEWGPRALGARSILADPRAARMKDVINAKVKFREPYRPFAPAVLEERTGEYFDWKGSSPYMLFVCDVLPEKRSVIPAVTHVDGTGRIQTVSRGHNPPYRRLIEEFDKITGVPVILNTSFNRRGEPIVTSPTDAIECFMATDIDCLIMGDYICGKKI